MSIPKLIMSSSQLVSKEIKFYDQYMFLVSNIEPDQ